MRFSIDRMVALTAMIAVALGVSSVTPTAAQSVIVSGMVLDANTYRPIPDVNISAGEGIGTTTDAAGAFSFRLPLELRESDTSGIAFRHVSYQSQLLRMADLRGRGTGIEVRMQPRIIPLEPAEITGARRDAVSAKELPLTVSTLESREFEVRGYIDAGDLLRTEHSVQVDEEFSGRKRVSIRGGNPDEVIVLYDGIRLNGSYTSDFDLSLIELSDIERFEIVKGSNTTLYGSEAFSGVINIVPKRDRDYTVRLHQQIGSYDSGIWGLQLFRRFGGFAASYSLRNGGMSRAFADLPEDRLTNSSLHHSGTMSLSLSGSATEAGSIPSSDALLLHWRLSSLEYTNERDGENLDDNNRFASLQYTGRVPLLGDMTLLAGYNGLDQDMMIRSSASSVQHGVGEDGVQARLEKRWNPGPVDLLLSYQFARSRLEVDDIRRNQREQAVGIEESTLGRTHHGLVAIGRLKGETGSRFIHSFDLDMSLRQDFLFDRQDDVLARSSSLPDAAFTEHDWSHTLFKFAVSLQGATEHFLMDVFLSYGNNVRYPTLFQQVNSPALLDPAAGASTLEPETNRSVEIGATVTRSLPGQAVSGWELQGSFFQNAYDNKFRGITTPGIPLAFFDNVDNAQISGVEGKARLFLWEKKVQAEFGISRYFISEKSAFPFKSEQKRTLGLLVDHAGYSLHIFHFAEGEQIGLLRQLDGSYAETALPAFSNLDVHASKFFDVGSVKLFFNISLRNLLGGDGVVLSGLALRDRRYYLTAGIQY